MGQVVAVRAMDTADIRAVLEIQSHCYDDARLESARSFLAKLSASPGSCFVAVLADAPVGYLVSVPVEAGRPPPLNNPDYSVPPGADSLYLHDLAVHPGARGAGVAVALIGAYFECLRQMGFRFGHLTAVNASSPFWRRYGFHVAEPEGAGVENMASYGEGARFMSIELDA